MKEINASGDFTDFIFGVKSSKSSKLSGLGLKFKILEFFHHQHEIPDQ
jgi:hypothetical protein